MPTRVFSQQPDLVASLPQLLQHARRFFAASIEVLEASNVERPEPLEAFVRLHFESTRHPAEGTFVVESRAAVDQDRRAAEAAEVRGRAGGMSLLAARCGAIWTLRSEGEPRGSAELQLSAVLASVALGPVLPADESTLYGVRGALERSLTP